MKSQASEKISKKGTQGALDKSSPGLIGYVTKYYPNDHRFPKEQRHTVDVDVKMGTKTTSFKQVPCFVYGQGLIDHGLAVNDRVWVQFINGDHKAPIVTAYYREPSQLDLFWNDLKYGISDFLNGLFGGS